MPPFEGTVLDNDEPKVLWKVFERYEKCEMCCNELEAREGEVIGGRVRGILNFLKGTPTSLPSQKSVFPLSS